jgi:hypothetical protein
LRGHNDVAGDTSTACRRRLRKGRADITMAHAIETNEIWACNAIVKLPVQR